MANDSITSNPTTNVQSASSQSRESLLQERLLAIANDIEGQVVNLKAKIASGQEFNPELAALVLIGGNLKMIATNINSLEFSFPSTTETSGTVSVSGTTRSPDMR
jgi:hypothetical protein